MEAKMKNAKWKIWLIALAVFVLVVVTAVYLCIRLGVFSEPDDRPYIALIPTDGDDTEPTANTTEAVEATRSGDDAESTRPSYTAPVATEPAFIPNPNMVVEDDQQVWTTDTQIELFRTSYENGQQEITVLSSDGDKVIAPGTENSYTFRLKNTGNVSLNYKLSMESAFGNVMWIPVEVRMRDYNGNYIIGDEENYAPAMELNNVKDESTIAVGHYAYYTLEWRWPFEWDNDDYDTRLGDWALRKPLTLTIGIHTESTMSSDPNSPGGLLLPQTGDDFQPVVWICVGAAALCGIVILPILVRRKRREDKE